jgi:hypothetical protein
MISVGGTSRRGIANRRGTTPRRFAFATIAVCIFAIAIAALLKGRGLDSATGRPDAPRRDVLSERLMHRLVAKAARTPATSGAWSRGSLHVLNREVSAQVWRLASMDTPERSCLVLFVPQVSREATCWRRADIAKRPVAVYMGERPDRRDPSRSAEYVVYGRVSPTARSLRLVLSDCSASILSLDARPLFWTFVPRAKLAQGVSPQTVIAGLRGGRTVRRELQPRSAARRSCSGQP